MAIKFNPFTSNFDFTGAASVYYLPVVNLEADLPTTDPDGAVRGVLATDRVYVYDLASTTWYDSGVRIAAFSTTADDKGLSIIQTVDSNITRTELVLHAADATHPGALTINSQEIAGNKDFQNDVIVQGQVKTDTIDTKDAAGTLAIGIANADIINIGRSGSTVNIIGTTNTINVTNLDVTDKNITLNDGGAAGSGSDAGIEVEEAGSITGYVKVSADRNSFRIKAPNASGEVFIAPNNDGFSQVINSETLTTNRTLTIPDITGTAVVTEGAQTVNGDKTLSGTTKLTALTASTPLKLDASKNIISADIELTTDVTGKLPVANGGTNSDTALNNNRIMVSSGGSIVEASALTNGQLLIGNTGGPALVGSISAGAGISIGNGAGTISVTNTTVLTGDIAPTSFVGAENTASPTDVTALTFSNSDVRSFEATIDVVVIATPSYYESFTIKGLQRGSDWILTQSSTGDNAGVAFSITTAGQIQYISTSYTGFTSLNMKFSAKVMPI